jgi:uncharacterized protein (DUF1810 family)
MTPADPFDLDRFVISQDAGGTYLRAVAELRAGVKTGHWMWFVFPQAGGLGQSQTSRTYAIKSIAEAKAYLRHPVLGPRLTECALILTQSAGRTAERIFGPIDAMKLRSCMTLFRSADPGQPIFSQILDLFFEGQPDPLTERAIATAADGEFRPAR